ncbi:MAG: divalent-cation tolerance protein CutA [Candidatus Bathyarchaeota archaeon]|nr:divalent-cation tolerance protein CutA [Candidatus Bathyarchaeota archaeon]
MEKEYAIVLVTAANREEAEKISKALLNERLIACANIIGPSHSLFWWNEKIESAEEYVLLMKTRIDMFERLVEKVKVLHSYEVPEIIVTPILKGFKPYLEWLNSSLR